MTLIGFHLIYQLQVAQLRVEMKKHIRSGARENAIIKFSFNKQQASQLEWEDGHEFRYMNEMYDVVEKKIVNGILIIRCIPDKKETALLSGYLQQHESSAHRFLLLKLVNSLFTYPSIALPAVPNVQIIKHYNKQSTPLISLPRTKVAPPPRTC